MGTIETLRSAPLERRTPKPDIKEQLLTAGGVEGFVAKGLVPHVTITHRSSYSARYGEERFPDGAMVVVPSHHRDKDDLPVTGANGLIEFRNSFNEVVGREADLFFVTVEEGNALLERIQKEKASLKEKAS